MYAVAKYSPLKIIWNFLFILFYPIITSFSLVFMGVIYVFSGISRLLSRVSTSQVSGIELKKPVWKHFISCGHFQLQHIFVDEIMFGPSYFKIKADPPVPAFENHFFGDFHHPCFHGVLLQKWNSTQIKDLPDFELIYMNCETGAIKGLGNIKSFSWNLPPQSQDDVVILKWFNGSEGGEIRITEADL